MGLAGNGCHPLEVSVVMEDDRPVVFGHRRSEQVDDTSGAVLAARRHHDLNVPGALGDDLGYRQHDVQAATAPGDESDIGVVTSRVTGLQVDRDRGRRRLVGDEPGDNGADFRVVDPCLR